jgi:hypothetical protein
MKKLVALTFALGSCRRSRASASPLTLAQRVYRARQLTRAE